ncbi:MAG: hypothetical protein B6D63_03620 [Candidatus Latescibacteria bacterium 4484_7]|nr:MAG: hypothetical protein B6D63_03620 [Candidatus Latescibacteria bacterium 4484_7]RKZ06548.1 MAG: hypothetical protein DRQ05_04605 [bacterium]
MNEETNEETVELIAVQGEVEASVIKGLLGSAGIMAIMKSDVVQGVTPITVDGLGVVKVFVKQGDLERARELIEEYRRGE